jgi:hypothetical protein
MYSEDQFQAVGSLGNLYLDATGTVCQEIPGQPKRVLYYALVCKAAGATDAPLPVAECLTNEHGTTNLTHFLACFVRDWKKCRSDMPVKVETDFSWALIHASLTAFNATNMVDYSNKAMLAMKSGQHIQGTILHLCSAHMMHLFMEKIQRHIKERDVQPLIAKAMGCLITSQNLSEADRLFWCIAVLLGTRQNNQAVEDARAELQALVDPAVASDMDSCLGDNQRGSWRSVSGSHPFSVQAVAILLAFRKVSAEGRK